MLKYLTQINSILTNALVTEEIAISNAKLVEKRLDECSKKIVCDMIHEGTQNIRVINLTANIWEYWLP